jgi:uncharacterized membrane protein
MMLGIGAPFWLLILVVGASILVTYGLVFIADFGGRRRTGNGILGHPWSETVAAYAVSLLVAAVMLWFFGRLDATGPGPILGMIVMLAVVSSVGAAVARLLVGGHKAASSS